MNIVIFGVGAVGTTVGSWLARCHSNTYFLARGRSLQTLRAEGLRVRQRDAAPAQYGTKVRVIASLDELDRVDVVVLCVKNYALDEAANQLAKQLQHKAGTATGSTTVVAIQNGIENQRLLPKYFERVIYAIAQHNAWLEGPANAVFLKKRPLILGTPTGALPDSEARVVALFRRAMSIQVTTRFQDAAHNKLLANMSSSLLSLIGDRPLEQDLEPAQRLFAQVFSEGVRILSEAGYEEYRLDALAPWWQLRTLARLPKWITRPAFRGALAQVERTSMQQDLMQGGGFSELESINGRLLSVAAAHGTPAPYHQALYALCRSHFQRQPYVPLGARQSWAQVEVGAQRHIAASRADRGLADTRKQPVAKH